jgi:hypothetical protein
VVPKFDVPMEEGHILLVVFEIEVLIVAWVENHHVVELAL